MSNWEQGGYSQQNYGQQGQQYSQSQPTQGYNYASQTPAQTYDYSSQAAAGYGQQAGGYGSATATQGTGTAGYDYSQQSGAATAVTGQAGYGTGTDSSTYAAAPQQPAATYSTSQAYPTQTPASGYGGYTAGYGGQSAGYQSSQTGGGRYGGQQSGSSGYSQGYGGQSSRQGGSYGAGGGSGGNRYGSRDSGGRGGGYSSRGGGGGGGSYGGRGGGGRGGGGHGSGPGRGPVAGQSASVWRDLDMSGSRNRDKDRDSKSDHGGSRHRDDSRSDRDRDGRDSKRDDRGDDKSRSARSKEPDSTPTRRAKSPRKASPARKREPEYAVKVGSHSYASAERDYSDTHHRYSRLYIPSDFAKCVSLWTQEKPKKGTLGCSLIALDNAASFEHTTAFEASKAEPATNTSKAGTVYNARVALLCGLDEAAKKEVLKGANHGGSSLNKLLKFLTVRSEKGSSKEGICLVGGPVDVHTDGDPTRGKKGLTNACIRHAKSQLDLDLSHVKNWLRFIEVHYQRPSTSGDPDARESLEVSVVFLVDASECMPSSKDWPAIWEKQEAWKASKAAHENSAKNEKAASEKEEKKEGDAQKATGEGEKEKPDSAKPADTKEEDKAEEIPSIPTILAKGSLDESGAKWRSACISLDGLLDYDEEDREEGTLEMNLLAENFSDLLSRDYALLILEALYGERRASLRRREERKRKRDEEKKADEEADAKKAKEAAASANEAKKPTHSVKEVAKNEVGNAKVEDGDVTMEDVTTEAAANGSEVKAEDDAAAVEAEADGIKVDGGDDGAEAEAEDTPKRGRGRGGRARGRGRAKGGRGRGRGKKASASAEQEEEEDPETPAAEAEEKIEQVDGAADGEETDKATADEGTKADTGEAMKPGKEVNEELLLAFRYFDTTGTGYIKVEDMKRILHNAGQALSHRTVKDLCANVSDRDTRRSERIYYKDICEKPVSA